jgi:polar amino acid transport system substrate-binding protein
MRRLAVVFALLLALVAAGCGGEDDEEQAAPPAEQVATGGGGDTCAPGSLPLVDAGKLTIGTDNPAYPPWFGGAEKAPWKISDPRSGEGFESAVAYAVADQLGFSKAEVEWTVVPFNLSFKPGPKDFDFDINQISYSDARAKAVDFSESYYEVNQALVAFKGTKIAGATTLADLAQYKLGAQVGTTSFDLIENTITPSEDPAIFDTQNDAFTALSNGQVDGVVADLPTALYVADPFVQQVKNSVVVGQFPSAGAPEHFGLVLEKDSPLTSCVNEAIGALRSDGTLSEIQQKWLSEKTNVGDVPVIE